MVKETLTSFGIPSGLFSVQPVKPAKKEQRTSNRESRQVRRDVKVRLGIKENDEELVPVAQKSFFDMFL